MTATQRVTRCRTEKFSRESPGSRENLRRQPCASVAPPAFLYEHPENCPISWIRTRYSLTCSSRSSAAQANPLISHTFCTPSSMSRHAVPSLRRSRYSSTPAAVDCLTRHVCAHVRNSSPSTPFMPWKRRILSVTRAWIGRVTFEHTPAISRTCRTPRCDAKATQGYSPGEILQLVSYDGFGRITPTG